MGCRGNGLERNNVEGRVYGVILITSKYTRRKCNLYALKKYFDFDN